MICTLSYALANPEAFKDFKKVYFLSSDYSSFLSLKNKLGEKAEQLGRHFHNALEDCESEILGLSEDLERANQGNDFFWFDQIATPNSASTPYVKQLVYLHAAIGLIQPEVAFVCESGALAKVLSRHLGQTLLQTRFDFLRHAWLRVKPVLRALVSAYRISSDWVTAGNWKGLTKYDAIIVTWVTEGSLKRIENKRVYNERIYGELYSEAKKNNLRLLVAPWFFNIREKWRWYIDGMRENGIDAVHPLQVMRLSDLLFFLKLILFKQNLVIPDFQFKGVKVRDIFVESQFLRLGASDLWTLNLHYMLFKSLRDREVEVERIIYPFENNPCEKSLILGAQQFCRNSEIVGYQHSVWYHEQLNMKITKDSNFSMPLPDRILTMGPIYRDVLRQCGFVAPTIELAGALRFKEIFLPLPAEIKRSSDDVLVIFNFSMAQTLELLAKVAAIPNRSWRWVFKLHPLTDLRVFEKSCAELGITGYAVFQGSVREAASAVKAVLMAGASVSNLEVLCCGSQLLRLSLENDFNLDCIWDRQSQFVEVTTSVEIAQAIREALSSSTIEKDSQRNGIIENYFALPNYRSFFNAQPSLDRPPSHDDIGPNHGNA